MSLSFPDDLGPRDFLDAASLAGRPGPSRSDEPRLSPEGLAELERRAAAGRAILAQFEAEDEAAGYAPVSVGNVVAYDCPVFGPSRGRVLTVQTGSVLVQDLHPEGAREYWPRGSITVLR